MAQPKQKQPIKFSDLPVEIKEQIYELAVGDNQDFRVSAPIRRGRPRLPPMCFTSKSERATAVPACICSMTVCFSEPNDTHDFKIKMIGVVNSDQQMLAAVRTAKVTYGYSGGGLDTTGVFAQHLAFLATYPALSKITLEISSHDLEECFVFWQTEPQWATLVDKFSLRSLVAFPSLKCVDVFLKITSGYHQLPWSQRLREIRGWIRKAFREERGEDAVVELRYQNTPISCGSTLSGKLNPLLGCVRSP